MVWRLSFGLLRFAELRNLLRGVSEKVLTSQLRELERDGVINRMAALTSLPKVTYSLSPAGQTLIPLLEDLCDQAKFAAESQGSENIEFLSGLTWADAILGGS